MTPIEAIENVEAGLVRDMNAWRARIADESAQIVEEWAGLGRWNGQREDQAAALLARLRPILRDCAAYCERCEAQIDDWVADPFGREEGASC